MSRPHPSDRRRGCDPMALTIRAKSPMNMYMHKNCWNRMLKQMYWTRTCTHEHLSCTAESTCIHTSIHLTCSSFSLADITIAEVKWTRSLILRRSRSATSYVAATFHPTIGQCAPYSLSNTTTPKLGMIPQGTRKLRRFTHSQRYTTHLSQHSWVYQAIRELGKDDC